MKFLERYKLLLIIILSFILIIDRYYFALIAQWREDQATNLWLGFKLLENYPKVGLLSSVGVFNPNGMALISWPLTLLPNLIWISFSLGIFQIATICYLGQSLFAENKKYLLIFLSVALSSVTMRASGNELWNQWMITPVFILSIALVLKEKYFSSIFVVFLFPALYLAGASNFLAITLFAILFLAINRKIDTNLIKKIALYVLIVLLIYGLLTWLPLFSNVPLSDFSKVSKTNLVQKLMNFLTEILNYPKMLFNFAVIYKVIYLYDLEIITSTTKKFFNVNRMILMIQTGIFLCAIVWFLVFNRSWRDLFSVKINKNIFLICIIPVFVISITALMGGPKYASESVRLDQVVALVPLYYVTIFIIPLILLNKENQIQRIVRGLITSLVCLFIVVNSVVGLMATKDQLTYKGAHISNADVPLIDKYNALKFVAADWQSKSDKNVVGVDYDLAGKWEGVDKFGEKLNQFYKSPMTIGRSFDYELERVYGLKNLQEGIQYRSIGTGNYILSYAHENKSYSQNEKIFGRIKVSIK